MATPHIAAEPGDFAPAVLMPGDPKRAQRIAELLMDDARLVTDVRGMLGFTGTVNGRPLSVMGSGMGQPSFTIYATELFSQFGVSGSFGWALPAPCPRRSRSAMSLWPPEPTRTPP